MQSLTKLVPHPVTTTLVPTGTGLHSNVMGCRWRWRQGSPKI